MPDPSEAVLQQFGAALDQFTVIVRNWSGLIEHWTAGCERLYGYTPEQAVGQNCLNLLQTSLPLPLGEIEKSLAETGSWKGDIEHQRSDGTRLNLSAHWVAIPFDRSDPRRCPTHVVETQVDVTTQTQVRRELELAHEQLKRVSQELERSNEDLEQFARIASHDLAAPINSTRWLVEILLQRHSHTLSADGLKCVDQISRSLERMSDLVEGVLSHSRVGRQPIATGDLCDAAEPFTVALDMLDGTITSLHATITSDPLPEVAIAPQALTQLFQNLLSNALKYAKPGVPPSIHIAVQQQGAFQQFAVSDNGIGIESQYFTRIFQPLQRLSDTSVAGSGIGLATCKKIVERAGGRIWIESQPSVGSTFFFTLPTLTPARSEDSADFPAVRP